MPILSLIQQYGVPLAALLVFAGELGFPTGVPAEIVLLVTGSFAIQSLPSLLLAIMVVSASDLLGTTLLHLVSRTGGVRLLGRLRRPEHGLQRRIEQWRGRLGNHEVPLVFVARLLPLVRMWAAIGTGLLRFRVRNFLLGATPAAVLWAGVPLALGYFFRLRIQGFEARYTMLSRAMLIAIPVVSLIGSLVWWIRRANSLPMRVRRGRVALGLAAVTLVTSYVIKTTWANERVFDRTDLLLSPLAFWLAVLSVLAAALLTIAIADLRTMGVTPRPDSQASRFVLIEAITTITWVSLLCVAGVIIALLDRGQPGFPAV